MVMVMRQVPKTRVNTAKPTKRAVNDEMCACTCYTINCVVKVSWGPRPDLYFFGDDRKWGAIRGTMDNARKDDHCQYEIFQSKNAEGNGDDRGDRLVNREKEDY